MLSIYIESNGKFIRIHGVNFSKSMTIDDLIKQLNFNKTEYRRLDSAGRHIRVEVDYKDSGMSAAFHFVGRHLSIYYLSDVTSDWDLTKKNQSMHGFKRAASAINGHISWATASSGEGIHDSRPFFSLKIS